MSHSEFKNTCVRIALSLALLLSVFLPKQVSAQVVGASISGAVTDPSGSKMPGVDIRPAAAPVVSVQILQREKTRGHH